MVMVRIGEVMTMQGIAVAARTGIRDGLVKHSLNAEEVRNLALLHFL